MIQYVKRQHLDVSKYDFCIENSSQSRIYAFSWYLDIVADHWDVLVLDDYEAVMPVPWKKKYGIKYVYPPFWLLELGVFSLDVNLNIQPFFDFLFSEFRFVESRLNRDANQYQKESFLDKEIQVLPLNLEYDFLIKNFRKDRRKDLVKANNDALYHGSMDDNSISADVVDQASSYTDKNVEMKAINRQIKLISEIDKALARIREDIYGYCLDTAEPIGLKRLMARPVAKYTIAAQEKHEKNEKVHADD